ncbi:MAG: ECF transporter S component [Sulfolobales archaeon]
MSKSSTKKISYRYTAIDYAMLAVVAVVAGVVFYATWFVYEFGKVLGGPIVARLLSYGLWFIGAPLAATLIKKPGSAFLGETLGALVETVIPTIGGVTNLIYGVAQGLASEIGYAVFRYRRFDVLTASLAGALAGIPAVSLDALLFAEIASPQVMLLWYIASIVSGGIYGAVASIAVSRVYRG